MALGLKEIPDSRQYIGPSMQWVTYVAAPGVSDYVSGGYVINASDIGLSFILSGAAAGQNAAAQGFQATIVLAQTANPIAGLKSCKMQVGDIYLPNNATTTVAVNVNGGALTNSSGAAINVPFPDLPAGFNLTGKVWILEFCGY